jgi:hypothetical protein
MSDNHRRQGMNLTDRLRNIDKSLRISRPYPDGENNIYGQAADEIESLRERVRVLECRSLELPDHVVKNIVTEVDGYKVYCPTNNGGSYAAHHLRRIATELDDLNKEWDDKIQQELSPQEAGGS